MKKSIPTFNLVSIGLLRLFLVGQRFNSIGLPYTMSIDMWSFGCIICELCTGYPIFPGETEEEQISLIMEVIGAPPEDMIIKSDKRDRFFEADFTPKPFFNKRGR
jgi:dual specificity tyrosine-phosphorylation-regulated kinase 2/3/4